MLVIRTLSKSHLLTGFGVGYAIGHTDLMEALEGVKNSFNSYSLGRLLTFGSSAAIGNIKHIENKRRLVIASRIWLVDALKDIGFEVLQSAANCIFFRNLQSNAAKLLAELRKNGVIVRHLKLPRIKQHLRIVLGGRS